MRKTLMSSWLGVVLVAAALGAMPALATPAGATGATVVPLPGDRDGDGVADAADPCPDTVGSPLAADGFAGCLRIDQVVYQVLTGSQVSGQVVPQYGWRGQDVCVAGIKATLQARWYTDHDPATAEGSLTESTTSDANGFFAFDARLPFGTEYSVEVSPRAVVGDEVYCASARTEVYRHVENVGREVVASYQNLTAKVTGRVVVLDGAQVEQACSDLQTVRLMRRFDDRPGVEVASATFLGAGETFSIDAGRLTVGVPYYVEVVERGPEGFPDLCREARSNVTVMADKDDDGVLDTADACEHVAGPAGGAAPGCAVVERQLTAAYDNGRVSGALTKVTYPQGAGNPCELAMQVELWTVDGQGARAFVTSGQTGGGLDQTYSLAVSPLPNGTRYVVTTEQTLEPGIVLCGAAESKVRASDDRDDDGVPDAVDACRDVAGAAPTGCPTVARSVTASYRPGQLTGKVSVTSLGGAPTGACSSPARLQVWQIGQGGARVALGQPVSSLAGGSYSIDLELAPGTTVMVSALASDDPGLALCGAADSTQVVAFGDRDDDTVPDADDDCPDVPGLAGSTAGCPFVQRIVEASYAVGKVSGTARPVGSGVPAGACTGAPVAVSYAGPGGGQVRYDGFVDSDGAFVVDVGRLPVATTLTVTLDDYDHEGVAICPAVRPSTSVAVAGDRDDDGVPDASDVCPDVEGPSRATDSGCPVVHRRLDTSYADGVLSGSVVLVDPEASPEGACSARSFVEMYSVEGTMLKDGLWSGWTDPDGTFAAPVGRLAHGTAYYVWADPYLDPSAGICQTADESEVFLDRDGDGVPDRDDLCDAVSAPHGYQGCPKVDRSVTSKYDVTGAVSGRVRLMNPEVAPGTCLQATVRVLRIGADGVPTTIGSKTTEPDGSYVIALEHPLVGGDVYFAVIASGVDRDLAFCAEGQSGARVAPALPASR